MCSIICGCVLEVRVVMTVIVFKTKAIEMYAIETHTYIFF